MLKSGFAEEQIIRVLEERATGFAILKEPREIIEERKIKSNPNGPHSSFNGLSPTEFAESPDCERSSSWGDGQHNARGQKILKYGAP
jgi:hypothetical protein